jgi:hypothetical protein
MKEHNKYALLGLKALERAAAKVAENARKNNYKIPVWKNGRIEYEIPGIITEQASARAKINPKSWNWEKSHEIGYCYPVGESRNDSSPT